MVGYTCSWMSRKVHSRAHIMSSRWLSDAEMIQHEKR